MKTKTKKLNSLSWIADLLSEHPTFSIKPMFGCQGIYINGMLVLVLADKEEPWSGVLVCTSKIYHKKLMHSIKGLKPHNVLSKWLYISKNSLKLEKIVEKLIKIIQTGNSSIGVEPSRKK